MSRPPAVSAAVLVCDDFGARVADVVRGIVPATAVVAAGRPVPPTGSIVLAGVRPEPLYAGQLNALAFEQGRVFLPVWVDEPQLIIGPHVVPGESACYLCYERRVRQHDRAIRGADLLHAAYTSNPALRPGGWLSAIAGIAASLVAATLTGHAAGLAPGALRLVNTLSLIPSTGQLTGFTGCPSCDTSDTARRSWAELRESWASLTGVEA